MKRFKNPKKVAITCVILVALIGIGFFALNRGYDYFMKKVYPIDYSSIVEKEAAKNSLEPALVYSVIKAESNFQPEAKSKAGAYGLMQLMPSTFEWLQTKTKDDANLTTEDLLKPEINIQYGCKYLSMMLKEFKNQKTAICAYNAGNGAVNGWLKNADLSKDGTTLVKVPYPETEKYAASVLKNYETYNKLYKFK
jgi:soluble lytic murein transglycosylase